MSDKAEEKTTILYPDVIPSINRLYNFNSFAYIQRQGKTSTEKKPELEISFDTNGADAVGTEYRRVRGLLYQRISNDEVLKQIRDQVQYEKRLSFIAADVTNNTLFDTKNYRQGKSGETRNINELKPDGEYDCEHLSYIRGMLLHEGDLYAVMQGTRTTNTQFFFMSGSVVSASGVDDALGPHAFVASASTGNIIDPTYGKDDYFTTNRNFAQIVAGYPVLAKRDGHDASVRVYASARTMLDEATAQKRLMAIEKNPHDTATLTRLRGSPERDVSSWTPKLTKQVESAITRLKLSIEQECIKPVDVQTSDGSVIAVREGSLQTQHVDPECVKDEVEDVRINRMVTELARELARKVTSSAATKKDSIAFKPEEATLDGLVPSPVVLRSGQTNQR